ncbi:hypothetical protein TNCV_2608621 [Trichonephila clavipes]|uniref:Uncharacterized protein n=1 Tax=Trichonephila clavipes TaxID=2585209 RepID=A0A8X6RV73_TRICX|nr:hypothetical protein TNCV_2608621 [Trichonephila clavipes]
MSSFLVLCEGDTRNRWRNGQVCPDVDKELWRLGPDGSGVFWRVMRKSDEGGKKEGRSGEEDDETQERERTIGRKRRTKRVRGRERMEGERRRDERRRQERRRKGLSPEIGEKKTMNAGGVENGNMN